MIFVGIDPGKEGALAVLDHDGQCTAAEPLRYTGGEIDVRWLLGFYPADHFAVEQQFGIAKDGVRTVAVIMRNYGRITGALEAMLASLVTPQPKEWKNVVLRGTARDKEAAIAYVRKRYPGVDLYPGRKRNAHDGIADAVCIAEWIWRQHRREA